MNLADYFTLGRIVLSPIFVLLYLYHESLGIRGVLFPCVLIFVVLISELSDVIDGIIARRKNQVTDLGKLIDPMADSIFRISVFLTFTQGVVGLPLILVLVIFYRDSIISTLRTICALRGVALGARLSGKIKAILLAVVVFFILLLMIPYYTGYLSLSLFQSLSFYSVLVCALYTVYTGCEYIIVNRHFIKRALTK